MCSRKLLPTPLLAFVIGGFYEVGNQKMKEKIKIAIIDSGLHCSHPAFAHTQPILMHDEGITSEDFYGHGTAIYNIIRKVNDVADIINFRLEYVENGISEDDLVTLLKKIEKDYSFDIINLSLGINICEDLEGLFTVCKALTDKGTIILSAFDNAGSISYPAAFENIIGVTSGESCTRVDDFEYVDDTVVNIGAKGNIQRLAWNNPDYILLGGNSFACAHATVQVAKFFSDGINNFNDILKAFKRISRKQYTASKEVTHSKIPFKMNKAVLFPFNKEMHSLIRFFDFLKFQIVAVYDSKYSATVGSTTDHIMKADVHRIVIENIEKIDWSLFDTLILGHLDEMSNLINKQDLKKMLVNKALSNGKNVFSFDDISDLSDSPCIYCPVINKENVPPYRFGKLYRISKPVIGVYGTSSRQGKFTLQMELRKRLLKMDYTVGQIGSEPSSLLYGMDYTYPMGYNSSVYIQGYNAIRYLNSLMNDLCIHNSEIIITGSQSGVIPFDTGNIAQYSLPQFDFLLGTQPDAVILCVNPFDDFDYIARTIGFLETSVDCKVIAIMVFPMDLKDDWTGIYGQRIALTADKYNELKNRLGKRFSIPIYCLNFDSDIDDVLQNVISYFADDK